MQEALSSLAVFRQVLEVPALRGLLAFLRDPTPASYGTFLALVYENGCDLTRIVRDAVCEDENVYVRRVSRGEPIPACLAESVERELAILQELATLPAEALLKQIGGAGGSYETSSLDLRAEYARHTAALSSRGWGIYARHTMFRVEGGRIVPLRSPDPVTVSQLVGYDRERGELIANTEALLAGLPAANTLLCGDAGTGKSTTVKAVVNLLAHRGLRLIELRKEQLREIPAVMEELRGNPLKFILFLDDLSFNKNDDNFSALKAILEGSASVKAPNTVIYATSNRRHLVKETFSDREGDDVHRQDTVQELVSLSDRFGLTILFIKPNKALYLTIARSLAAAKGLPPGPDFDVTASAFALRKGGFTPRAAEQFTNSLLAKETET